MSGFIELTSGLFLNSFLKRSTIPSFAFWETYNECEKISEIKTDSIEKVFSTDK